MTRRSADRARPDRYPPFAIAQKPDTSDFFHFSPLHHTDLRHFGVGDRTKSLLCYGVGYTRRYVVNSTFLPVVNGVTILR